MGDHARDVKRPSRADRGRDASQVDHVRMCRIKQLVFLTHHVTHYGPCEKFTCKVMSVRVLHQEWSA
jgi:hypothetical protein